MPRRSKVGCLLRSAPPSWNDITIRTPVWCARYKARGHKCFTLPRPLAPIKQTYSSTMTSSVQPPTLNPSLGTPSDEWAKNTTSTLEPPSQGAPQNTTSGQVTSPSPGVTPGNELPGAFPNRGQGPGEPSTGTTNITETIVDTAKQYFPASVVNTVGNLFGTPLSQIYSRETSSQHTDALRR